MSQVRVVELKTLLGPDRISVDPTDLVRHSYDWSALAAKWRNQGKTPTLPELVVRPRSQSEVSQLLVWANRNKVPVTPWGAGSSVTGAALCVQGGICLDLSAIDQTMEIDPVSLIVRVGAGKRGNHLEQELNQQGFTLHHSPQSLDKSTVGGWLATRSSGQFSSQWGNIEDLCVSFTVVLPNGDVVETYHAPRAAVGPDLRHLFIGAEGILGVITEVTLKIFPIPEQQLLESVRFSELDHGLQAMRHIMQSGLRPFLLRLYDADESKHVMGATGDSNSGNKEDTGNKETVAPIMLLGCEGKAAIAAAEMEAAVDTCHRFGGTTMGSAPAESWMQRRYDFSAIQTILDSPGGIAETIEVAHFWNRIGQTYQDMKTALQPLAREVLGHFSHAYPQGTSLYLILLGEAENDQQAEATIARVWDVAMRECSRTGAAISHHHGIGSIRRKYLPDYLGSGFQLLRILKQAIDPMAIMNPDTLVS